MIFPENMGPYLSMDETSLSQGELYTIVTNKEAKGKKGAIVAMVKVTVSKTVTSILHRIPEILRNQVEEITIDLAATMELIAKRRFPKATIVSD